MRVGTGVGGVGGVGMDVDFNCDEKCGDEEFELWKRDPYQRVGMWGKEIERERESKQLPGTE